MNYYAPRKRKDNKWDYTCRNGDNVRPVGYCAGYHFQIPICNPEKYHTNGHRTYEEACACYKEYRIDKELVFHGDIEEPDTLHKCQQENCKEMTSGRAEILPSHGWWLCWHHRTIKVVRDLFSVDVSFSSY